MWSFSVLLWELVTREVPFADLSHMEIGMKVSGCNVYLLKGLFLALCMFKSTLSIFSTYYFLCSPGGARRPSPDHSTGDFSSYL